MLNRFSKDELFFKFFLLFAMGFVVLGGVKVYFYSYENLEIYIRSLTQIPLKSFLSPSHFAFLKKMIMGMCLFLGIMFIKLHGHTSSICRGMFVLKQDARTFKDSFFSFVKNKIKSLTPIERLIMGSFVFLGSYFMIQTALLPLRSDEATVFVSFSSKPYWMIPCLYTNVGNHIFHTLLMKISTDLFGTSLLAIRLPVLVAGILSLPLIFLVFSGLYTRTVGLGCMILTSTSSAFILFSGNSRGYVIQIFLSLCFIGLSYFLRKNDNKTAWVLWVLSGILAFWTVPTAIYFHAGAWVWAFYIQIKYKNLEKIRPFIYSTLTMGLGIILLYIPPFVIAKGLAHMSVMMEGSNSFYLKKAICFVPLLLQEWTFHWKGLYEFSCLMAAVGLIRDVMRRGFSPFVLVGLGITSFFMFMEYERLYLVMAIVFYGHIAMGLNCIFKKYALYICVAIGLWVGYQKATETVPFNNPQDAFPEVILILDRLKPYLKDNDAITADCPCGIPLYYHMTQKEFSVSFKDIIYHNQKIWTIHMHAPKTHDLQKNPGRLWLVWSFDKKPFIEEKSIHKVFSVNKWQVGYINLDQHQSG